MRHFRWHITMCLIALATLWLAGFPIHTDAGGRGGSCFVSAVSTSQFAIKTVVCQEDKSNLLLYDRLPAGQYKLSKIITLHNYSPRYTSGIRRWLTAQTEDARYILLVTAYPAARQLDGLSVLKYPAGREMIRVHISLTPIDLKPLPGDSL